MQSLKRGKKVVDNQVENALLKNVEVETWKNLSWKPIKTYAENLSKLVIAKITVAKLLQNTTIKTYIEQQIEQQIEN